MPSAGVARQGRSLKAIAADLVRSALAAGCSVEYIGPASDGTAVWPEPEPRLLVGVVRGTSEGWYIHVAEWDPGPPRRTLLFGKTLGTRREAYRLAACLSRLRDT